MHSFSFHDNSYLCEFSYNATWILVLGAWSLFLTEVIYV